MRWSPSAVVLHAGVRALNIDTHYGVPSTARVPGQSTPIILTDNVATVAARAENDEDPVAAKRATQLAAGAPKAAMTASPTNFSTVPPARSISADMKS